MTQHNLDTSIALPGTGRNTLSSVRTPAVRHYVSALYQDLIKTGEIAGRLLPPVLPMVVGRLSAVAHFVGYGG